jgi:hypothetical protein
MTSIDDLASWVKFLDLWDNTTNFQILNVKIILYKKNVLIIE